MLKNFRQSILKMDALSNKFLRNPQYTKQFRHYFLSIFFFFFTVIKKQNTLVCQFASPLDVDTHVKPEVMSISIVYFVVLRYY